MPSYTSIPPEKLFRLIGTPTCPILLDVRVDEDFAQAPRLIPGSMRRDFQTTSEWAFEFAGLNVIAICQRGQKLSEGVAAWLRHAGAASADILEGGYVAWSTAGLPTVPQAGLPPRDAKGRTVWVTRARPKVDRIACPWLIRRFVDASAVFLFVAPAEVEAVAARFGGAAFDIDGTFWSHREGKCTFDTMLYEWGLQTEPLEKLALIIRGADTGTLNISPEASGLLAASLGLSRMYADDMAQLEAGMGLYDAFYRWCRDASDETHNWHVKAARNIA